MHRVAAAKRLIRIFLSGGPGSADKPRLAPTNRSLSAMLAVTFGIFLSLPQHAAAQDCPAGSSVATGFVVERGERSKTEVFHVDETTVRTIFRYNAMLETTQYQGLFELERVDRGRRSVSRPTSDLSRVFPPNVGQRISARFEVIEGERRSTRTIVLSVRKLDVLHIGPCQYRVLQIDRSIGRDQGKPVFVETDYYSPVLKLIVAKEFKEQDGRTSINKFDRIYPIKR